MGILFDFLVNDHRRLDDLLALSVADQNKIDMKSYSEFRQGLLKHIGIEEKIILPAIARFQNGRQADVASRLRLDHGALVTLLVPTPTMPIILTIQLILHVHNPLEEGNDGIYHLIDKLAGNESSGLLERLKEMPDVPVLPHDDRPSALGAARRSVERAGYKAEF